MFKYFTDVLYGRSTLPKVKIEPTEGAINGCTNYNNGKPCDTVAGVFVKGPEAAKVLEEVNPTNTFNIGNTWLFGRTIDYLGKKRVLSAACVWLTAATISLQYLLSVPNPLLTHGAFVQALCWLLLPVWILIPLIPRSKLCTSTLYVHLFITNLSLLLYTHFIDFYHRTSIDTGDYALFIGHVLIITVFFSSYARLSKSMGYPCARLIPIKELKGVGSIIPWPIILENVLIRAAILWFIIALLIEEFENWIPPHYYNRYLGLVVLSSATILNIYRLYKHHSVVSYGSSTYLLMWLWVIIKSTTNCYVCALSNVNVFNYVDVRSGLLIFIALTTIITTLCIHEAISGRYYRLLVLYAIQDVLIFLTIKLGYFGVNSNIAVCVHYNYIIAMYYAIIIFSIWRPTLVHGAWRLKNFVSYGFVTEPATNQITCGKCPWLLLAMLLPVEVLFIQILIHAMSLYMPDLVHITDHPNLISVYTHFNGLLSHCYLDFTPTYDTFASIVVTLISMLTFMLAFRIIILVLVLYKYYRGRNSVATCLNVIGVINKLFLPQCLILACCIMPELRELVAEATLFIFEYFRVLVLHTIVVLTVIGSIIKKTCYTYLVPKAYFPNYSFNHLVLDLFVLVLVFINIMVIWAHRSDAGIKPKTKLTYIQRFGHRWNKLKYDQFIRRSWVGWLWRI